jgi:hypothetical protein
VILIIRFLSNLRMEIFSVHLEITPGILGVFMLIFVSLSVSHKTVAEAGNTFPRLKKYVTFLS